MTSILIALTAITGVVSAILLGLVIYGFRRYINRERTSPIDYIATGILLMAFGNVIGFVWWEVLPLWSLGRTTVDFFDVYSMDWTFNVLLIAGAWNMLKGFHLLVEEKEPGSYSVMTAVFYPRRLRLWLISHSEGE